MRLPGILPAPIDKVRVVFLAALLCSGLLSVQCRLLLGQLWLRFQQP